MIREAGSFGVGKDWTSNAKFGSIESTGADITDPTGRSKTASPCVGEVEGLLCRNRRWHNRQREQANA